MGYPTQRQTIVETSPKTIDFKNTYEYFPTKIILLNVKFPSGVLKAKIMTKLNMAITLI